MILIAGLGNPGDEYKKTRHSIGHRVIDTLIDMWGFGALSEKKKLQAAISSGQVNDQEVIVIKTTTFMNTSGQAIRSVLDYHTIPYTNLVLVHDDSDLSTGEFQVADAKGSAGHKGVASTIATLGTNEFTRVRIGVRPKGETGKAEEFVLKNFSKKEEELLGELLPEIVSAIEDTIETK